MLDIRFGSWMQYTVYQCVQGFIWRVRQEGSYQTLVAPRPPSIFGTEGLNNQNVWDYLQPVHVVSAHQPTVYMQVRTLVFFHGQHSINVYILAFNSATSKLEQSLGSFEEEEVRSTETRGLLSSFSSFSSSTVVSLAGTHWWWRYERNWGRQLPQETGSYC